MSKFQNKIIIMIKHKENRAKSDNSLISGSRTSEKPEDNNKKIKSLFWMLRL